MWRCQECGRRFKTTGLAERAALNGCPGCGGVDIDLDDTGHLSDAQHGGAEERYDVTRTEDGDPEPPRAA
jgi:hypothetical protein